ncbi:MAG TPA: hypothetical protein PLI95_26550, partial [Polyangiaceae bacterium]|nr:hypothetical protein [Polyangiaceae bacterium]
MRTLFFSLAALSCLTFVGCSDDDDTAPANVPPADASVDQDPTDAGAEAAADAAPDTGVDADDPRFAALTAAIEAERVQLGSPGVA